MFKCKSLSYWHMNLRVTWEIITPPQLSSHARRYSYHHYHKYNPTTITIKQLYAFLHSEVGLEKTAADTST